MRILIIGSGGREHALAWKLRQSRHKPEIFIAPGNGGTALEGTNLPIKDSDIPGLMAAIKEHKIDFVVPGPELPLTLGIVDACKKAGIPCFGPTASAAAMEGSKAFAKNVMKEGKVPTAEFEVFSDHDRAVAYVKEKGAPIVIKADGLAAGKGVVVARTEEEALAALDDMMVKKIFGKAGETVVIEAMLTGEEASFLVFCDGDTIIPLPSAQDHKAAYDGDKGPNTGGMGAYSPAPVLPESGYREVIDKVIKPTLEVLKKRGAPYSGILYAGLMMTADGPSVVEFNVRFGDPECQPLLMRLDGDLLDVLMACANGKLDTVTMKHRPETAVCVVIAARGYPGPYAKGMEISGLDAAEAVQPGMVKVFQAGTTPKDGKVLASGGRVLGVTALGKDLAEARKTAYEAAAKVVMAEGFYRKDIGDKGLRLR